MQAAMHAVIAAQGCGSEAFHNVADRWPEAIDIALLARCARAFANGAVQFARETG